MGYPGPSWGQLGAFLVHLGAILGYLGPSGAIWGQLGAIWTHLGPSGTHLGSSWGHLGAILGPSWGHLGPSWAILSDLTQDYDRKGDMLKNAASPTRNANFAGQDGAKMAPRWHLDGLKPASEAS